VGVRTLMRCDLSMLRRPPIIVLESRGVHVFGKLSAMLFTQESSPCTLYTQTAWSNLVHAAVQPQQPLHLWNRLPVVLTNDLSSSSVVYVQPKNSPGSWIVLYRYSWPAHARAQSCPWFGLTHGLGLVGSSFFKCYWDRSNVKFPKL